MATVYWWVVRASEQNAATRPADAHIIGTPDSGAEYNALVSGQLYQGIARYQGPFTTRAEAQAANPAGEGPIQQALAGIQAGTGQVPGFNLLSQNPLTSLQNLGASLKSIIDLLSSRQGWVRIAEVIIGSALVIVAVAELAKGTTAGKLASKVPVIT